MIAAHTDPKQLRKLVEALAGVGCDFYIHIDKKSSITPFVQQLKGMDVNFIKKRVSTNWGGVFAVRIPKESYGGSLRFG